MAELVEADVCRPPATASAPEPEDAVTLVNYVEIPESTQQSTQRVAQGPSDLAAMEVAPRQPAVTKEANPTEVDQTGTSMQSDGPSDPISNTTVTEEKQVQEQSSGSDQLAPKFDETDMDITNNEGQPVLDTTLDPTSSTQAHDAGPTAKEQAPTILNDTQMAESPSVVHTIKPQGEQTLKVAETASSSTPARMSDQEEREERYEAQTSEAQQSASDIKPNEAVEESAHHQESSAVQSDTDATNSSTTATEDDGNTTLSSSISDDVCGDSLEKQDDHVLKEAGVQYDQDQGSCGVVRLRPTSAQWEDFPAMLKTARKLGAEKDGCFKIVLPEGLLGPLPGKPAQTVPANAYKPHQLNRTRIWQVGTIPTNAKLPASDNLGTPNMEEPAKAFIKLQKLFDKNRDRQLRDVRYRVDVPAWNAEQRQEAGVPEKSPLHPLKGDKLDRTRAIIPGIHTPYVYESGPAFGATFQIHAEDYRLSSLNHLYEGRKIWIVMPPGAVDLLEEKLERRGKCSQFMRHRAEFLFPSKLDRLKIPYRIIDQRPGETIVILPDAYHEGFSTGYTLAEAKNYAEPDWSAATYQPCNEKCQLATMIPAEYMELVDEGEQRIDLCALQDAEDRKRKREEEDANNEHEAQRPKLSAEVASVH